MKSGTQIFLFLSSVVYGTVLCRERGGEAEMSPSPIVNEVILCYLPPVIQKGGVIRTVYTAQAEKRQFIIRAE